MFRGFPVPGPQKHCQSRSIRIWHLCGNSLVTSQTLDTWDPSSKCSSANKVVVFVRAMCLQAIRGYGVSSSGYLGLCMKCIHTYTQRYDLHKTCATPKRLIICQIDNNKIRCISIHVHGYFSPCKKKACSLQMLNLAGSFNPFEKY